MKPQHVSCGCPCDRDLAVTSGLGVQLLLPMQSLTYISGPPCSGKTVACKCLVVRFPDLSYVVGDNYWIQTDGLGFDQRVARTNEMIIQDLKAMRNDRVLLEWVPAFGTFRDDLKDICETHRRAFNQIVLYARTEELRKRKRERDGDEGVVELDASHF
jgi:hypothetical protein